MAYHRAWPTPRCWFWVCKIPAIHEAGNALVLAVLGLMLPRSQTRPVSLASLGIATLGLFGVAFAGQTVRHLKAFHENRILGREVLVVVAGRHATKLIALASTLVGIAALAIL